MLGNFNEVRYWADIFERVYQGKIDSWAYIWTFCCWLCNGLSILPNINLVSNIGFGKDATFTQVKTPVADLPTEAITFPLSHPPYMIKDSQADAFTAKSHFARGSIIKRISKKLVTLSYCLWDNSLK